MAGLYHLGSRGLYPIPYPYKRYGVAIGILLVLLSVLTFIPMSWALRLVAWIAASAMIVMAILGTSVQSS